MYEWRRILNESPIEWLLDEENPSVRCFTLQNIMGKNENDAQVVNARRAISGSRVVSKIFAKQSPEGYWEEPCNPYLPKYKSSYWQIMTLGYLGMDRTDSRVEKACERIFQFQTREGAFISQTRETLLKEYELRLKKGRKLPPRGGCRQWSSRTSK